MLKNWENKFKRIILERGEEYYYENHISRIQKEDYGYSAIVEGNDDYVVDIFVEDNEIVDMECDCPYALDGKNCKHMAAVLYAIEASDFDLKSKNQSIDEILEMMSDEQVRNEFREILKQDNNIRNHIYNKYRKNDYGKDDIKMFREALRSLAYDYGDRHGFVDWESGYDYVEVFKERLDEFVSPMLEKGENLLAFECLVKAFDVLNDVDMDGSNGEHSEIAYAIKDHMNEAIDKANSEDRKKMHEWVKNAYNNLDDFVVSDAILELYEYGFTDEEYLLELLKETRSKLEDPEDRGYMLEHNLELLKSILERLGRSDEEYENWLKKHEDLTTVIEIRLKQAEINDDVDKMIEILEKMCNDERFRWKEEYRRRLLKLYIRNNDTDKQKETLVELVFKNDRPKLEEVYELKKFCDEKEWEAYRNKIAQQCRNLRLEIYKREGMLAELANSLKDYPIEETNKYAKYVGKDYKDILLKRYIQHLLLLEHRSPCRSLYDEMNRYLLLAFKYDDNGKETEKVLKSWKNKYPKRKVMQETVEKFLMKINKGKE